MLVTDRQAGKAVVGVPILVVAGLLLAGFASFRYLDYRAAQQPAKGPVLTPEARAYVRYLKLSEVTMKATDSYLKQTVIEVEGKITNTGDRRLNLVEINCVFRDAYAQLVLRRRMAIVSSGMGGLKPGETKSFRLPFDDLPKSWSQAVPELVIAQILFD